MTGIKDEACRVVNCNRVRASHYVTKRFADSGNFWTTTPQPLLPDLKVNVVIVPSRIALLELHFGIR